MENSNDIPHDREVFDRLDDRINIEEAEINGKKRIVLLHGYKHLFDIEKFVNAIEKGWLGGFLNETSVYSGRRRLRVLYLGKQYYRKLNTWLERYSDIPRYSERVTVFYDVCRELGFVATPMNYFGKPEEFDDRYGVQYADWYNELIQKISERIKSREFKERERWRRKNAQRNEQNVLAMNEEMYKVRSRWVILMLTLNYEKPYRRWITLDDIQKHREKFFAARRYNKLMSGIKNYVWTIEQGEKTGFHLHVILYYSAKHRRDVSLAQRIGEYWADVVTDGKGAYWNSNARKAFHALRGYGIGTGQIDRKDREKRESLKKNLLYLAKASQYLMIKGAERVRTFDMGQVPEKRKEGRPRKDADVCEEVIDDAVESVHVADANASADIPWDYAVVTKATVCT
ncbi:inovirus-type Gp2 protein [Burkholderia pseudomallei]|uniref:inovirus-type Gp2 protein n=1 Tax=Burkholderia pseudomallei TaxID=28450 RepID=UPI0009B55DAB|nr:inovirus-type Gp2 protein [Burkholderia pseudomallei]NAX51853.1 inovirus-type Gp2 protein [Burkholderia pseudomallei]NAX71912.1 inovirus-type Gp2 protein [Burkholderia pseudomallei]NAY57735.1 inovirus-type Gp2 protein [Burkholderia pseudomallei]NAY64056.1 inovirus-type Gp2 protein [Burkholderia pseudomallei]NAY70821.1 inovirus-type Gp2 protein [Burkholderia pseudomallei]